MVGIPVDRLETVTNFIREVCIDSVDPPVERLVVEHLRLPASTGEELPVIKVDVPRSLFVHRSPGGYLHRMANSRRQMSTEYLARCFNIAARPASFDLTSRSWGARNWTISHPVSGSVFRTARSGDDREAFLGKLKMAQVDEEGVWRPTVAGVLMASEDPREWLPNAYVQAVAYRGNRIRAKPGTIYHWMPLTSAALWIVRRSRPAGSSQRI